MLALVVVHMRVFSVVRTQSNGGSWYTIILFTAPITVSCRTCTVIWAIFVVKGFCTHKKYGN